MKTTLPLLSALLFAASGLPGAAGPRPVHVVPNFHPASCGWLTDWSTERNYCANSYLDHLDRVRDDPNYAFALSECNNLIAILNFAPARFEELKRRIREGRVELCNAFFLEPTINLSGGEALVKCGVEGLRWQRAMFGVRPRLAWMIDVTGMHEQMAQISAGLGLDGFVYCRHNPTGSAIHWAESPDGTRSLALAPGPYADWRDFFKTTVPLTGNQLAELRADLQFRADPTPLTPAEVAERARPSGGEPRRAPAGAPLFLMAGSGDYSLAPLYQPYPSEFLREFRRAAPEFDVRFSTPSRYLDAVLPGIASGAIQLPVMRGGTMFNYNAFWIQNARVKTWFRQCEQQLRDAEMLATAASLRGRFDYPVQDLHHAWLLLCLNMDRNTLWGAAGGMVFEHERSWDARDRFEWVENTARHIAERAVQSLCGAGGAKVQFNPLNWTRRDHPSLDGCGFGPAPKAPEFQAQTLPPAVRTKFYRARIEPGTGALVSLQLQPGGRELLGGPANVIVAEQPKKKIWSAADQMVDRPERERVADSNPSAPRITVRTGSGRTVVEVESTFPAGAGRLRRTLTFHDDNPRIDCETELNDVPDRSVVVAEFPLAGPVREVRRGIPGGFAHAAWATPDPDLPGFAKGITPAVRWSHYQMNGAGLALLDRGLTGREIEGSTALIFLHNANGTYRGHPNSWLSGEGRHVLRYALLAHEGEFAEAGIARAAWEFNNPPVEVAGCATPRLAPFLRTSENLIVEALRREGGEIELRLVECLGLAGTATVTLDLPHAAAFLTNLLGEKRQPLRGGPGYEFPVRPQQIVTLRFPTATAVPDVRALTAWDELVPAHKREALHRYLPDVKGHPPADWLKPKPAAKKP